MNTKSLYVHIPFCDFICGYCDFNRVLYNRSVSDQFLIKLLMEINQLPNKYETIYVGGGTPTALTDDQLESLLQALSEKLTDDYEWTFEGNPNNITSEKVALLSKYGVNRMSLGVQTSDPELLQDIGRQHTFYDVETGVQILRENGIDNISLDLMYALPNQTMDNFITSIKDVLRLNPSHVSIYALILEPNSLFGKENIKPVSNEQETDMYLKCIEIMKEYGYEHYEISNFAKDRQYSRHNLAYWHYNNFEALGPGASSKIDNIRKTRGRSIMKYLREEIYDEIVELDTKEAMFEFIMMGLRLKEGIEKKRFFEYFNESLEEIYKTAINQAVDQGLLINTSTHIKASDNGFIMLDDILLLFMD